MALVAMTMYYFGHRTAAYVLCGMMGLIAILATFAPDTLETVQAMANRLVAWIATGVGLVLLGVVYFTVFVPGGFLARLRGVDALNREFPANGRSKWITRANYGADKLIYSKLYTRPHAAAPPPGDGT